ncbi:MAG: hypothetical protein GDA45_07360 [Chromatiales bacterium]|nr:hypothetical protein [Chromatiales bacterium]
MMVIRAQNAADRGIPAATGAVFNLFPADRCTWQQIDSTLPSGYSIQNARFINTGGGATTNAVTLTNATLGYIGKSGRFVAISE